MKKQNKGFTLAELLIVVAIIAVLVAIAMPIFVSQTEKAREATDIANMRGAYASMSLAILEEDNVDGKSIDTYTATNPIYYNLDGSLTSKVPTAYGKGTRVDGQSKFSIDAENNYSNSVDYTDQVIMCWYKDGIIHIYWTQGGTSKPSSPTNSNTYDGKTINTVELPTNLTGKTFSVSAGTMYTYKDKKYVALSSLTMNEWYAPLPDTDSGSWLYITPTNKVITSSSTNKSGTITVALKTGDIYSNGENLYIRKTDAYENQSQIPSLDSGNWQLITK